MKNYFVQLSLCITFLICSCQKEDFNDTVLNSTTLATDSATAARKIRLTQATPKVNLQYGSLIDAPPSEKNWLAFETNVAEQLGISCLRGSTLVPATWSSVTLLNSSYNVVLNFNSARGKDPVPYVTNLTKYKTDLNAVLNTYTTMPVVAVVENEEFNRLYYTGAAQDYINQLTTAIGVLHERGVKVANGGLGGPGLQLLVYQDFLNQGKEDSAQMFLELTNLTPRALTIQERAAFIDYLLESYSKMNVDFINFHWKGDSPNADAFGQVVNYLRKRTNKPIINNELGQFDTDPKTVTAHLQKAKEKALAYVLWYSPDEYSGQKATSLQRRDASLTTSGVAYQNFPKN